MVSFKVYKVFHGGSMVSLCDINVAKSAVTILESELL